MFIGADSWLQTNQDEVLVLVAIVFFMVVGYLQIRWLLKLYVNVTPGQALVLTPMAGKPRVTFNGAIVFPQVNTAEVMDISLKTIAVDHCGDHSLVCKDNIRIDVKANFLVRVNHTLEDVCRVVQGIEKILSSTARADQVLAAAKENEALGELLRQLMSLLKDERFDVQTGCDAETDPDSAKASEVDSENET